MLCCEGDVAMWQRLSAFLILAALLVSAPLSAIAQQTPQPAPPQPPTWYWGPGPWHMWGDGYGWHYWWWMPPLMMLFMLLVCAAVVYLFARRHHGAAPWQMTDRMWGPPTHSALQILNERFARGDIQKDEYEDRKAAILSSSQQH
jgi:putative membrane protein